jgi:hypothetical protein
VIARILRSPVFALVAAGVALALLVVTAVVVVRFLSPAERRGIAELAPSAFAIELAPASSPLVQRGQTVTLSLALRPTAALDRVELWADDDPVLVIDGAELGDTAGGLVQLALDYVPVSAGAHVLMARAVDADGRVAQSSPFATAVRALEADIAALAGIPFSGPEPAVMSFRSAPGDTASVIAGRLGVPIDWVRLTTGELPGDGTLPTGTKVWSPVPSLAEQAAFGEFRFPEIDWLPGIEAEVVGCDVVVRSVNVDHELRVYGGAGFAALGDLPAGGELVLGSLPIGSTTLIGYRAGTRSDTASGENAPTKPVTVVLPDECARSGWSGDAYVTGGILLTDVPVLSAYAYVSVDKGDWQRVPAASDATLSTGMSLANDLRSYLDLAAYDQVDIEVWSAAGGAASRAASGQFCRADIEHVDASAGATGSSNSGGECDPPLGSPNEGFPLTAGAGAFTIESDAPAPNYFINVDPLLTESYSMQADIPLTFDTNAADLGIPGVVYQFSFFPISPNSAVLDPPGVFYSRHTSGAWTADVSDWRGMHLDDGVSSGLLALDDETALAFAQARQDAGLAIVDRLYVRAVAVNTGPGGAAPVSLGLATTNIEVIFPGVHDERGVQIENVQASFQAGDDFLLSGTGSEATGYSDTCHAVASYPQPDTWGLYPTHAPRPPAAVVGQPNQLPEYYPSNAWTPTAEESAAHTDLAVAQRAWPSDEVVYCLDRYAEQKRYAAAIAARDADKECGLGCVITLVLQGAAMGLAYGGPWGALVGAVVGLAVGVASAASPEFYARFMEAWNAIAEFYNGVFDEIWKVIDRINPVCQGIGELSGKAQDFCNGTFRAVGTAILSYYTGLPPTLATADQIEAIDDTGNLEAALIYALDAGLRALGLPGCSDLSLSESQVDAIDTGAGIAGLDLSEAKAAADDGEGGANACSALARVLVAQLKESLTARHGAVMAAVTGESYVPGLVLTTIQDTTPYLRLRGTPAEGIADGGAHTCTVWVDVAVQYGQTRVELVTLQAKATLRYGLSTAAGSVPVEPYWEALIQLPLLPSTYPDARFIRTTSLNPGGDAPFAQLYIDSPCFGSVVSLTGTAYPTSLLSFGTHLWKPDDRPVEIYW